MTEVAASKTSSTMPATYTLRATREPSEQPDRRAEVAHLLRGARLSVQWQCFCQYS